MSIGYSWCKIMFHCYPLIRRRIGVAISLHDSKNAFKISEWKFFTVTASSCHCDSWRLLFCWKCHHTDLYLLKAVSVTSFILQWYHNEHNGISNHQHLDCLLNRLFRRISKKTSKFHVTGICKGNPTVTGGFPSQRINNVENVSIWGRHHVTSNKDELPWWAFHVNLLVFCDNTNVA